MQQLSTSQQMENPDLEEAGYDDLNEVDYIQCKL